MKHTEIPAAKCYGEIDSGKLCPDAFEEPISHYNVPCTLRTAEADKLLVELAKTAVAFAKSGKDTSSAEAWRLYRAVGELEKAGVKL